MLNFLQWQSLKTRITLYCLGIFLFGLWSLAFYASGMLRGDMQRLLGDQQFSTLSFMVAQIDQDLKDRVQVLEKIASKTSPMLLSQPVALQAFLSDRLLLQDLFNGGVIAYNLDGMAIAEVPLAAGRVGANHRARDYLVSTLEHGKPMVGQTVISTAPAAKFFAIAVPVHDEQGKVIGALAGVTNLEIPNFLTKITNHTYGQTGNYFLMVSRYRTIVATSDQGRLMEVLPEAGISPWIDRFVQGFNGSVVVVNPHGLEVLVSVKQIPVAGWYASVTLPSEEAFEPIRAMQLRMLVATILLTLLAGGATWWMLRRQLAPMLTAVNTLASLSDPSQPVQRLAIARNDEIGDLIGGFNHLLDTLSQREEQVRQLAFYDPLTKLSNRRLLNDRLSQAMAATRRNACHGALMFLDLDNFKSLNDAHGHGVGDLLLMEVAARLRQCVREIDTVSRFGGDEFVVMLSDLSTDMATAMAETLSIAEKIHTALATPYLLRLAPSAELVGLAQEASVVEHHCTASIGVIVFSNLDTSQDEILKSADAAMYQAKDAGRNTIRFFTATV